MTLHVYHGAHLASLVQPLADVLAVPVADPFAVDVIAVPTVGVRDWLQQELAFRLGASEHRDGITANIDFVFPNRFTSAALGQPIHQASPWDIDQLTWVVLETLQAEVVDVPGWRRFQAHAGATASGAYATARRIADLFDRYANNRPQLLQQWAAGHKGDGTEDEHEAVVPLSSDHAWQAELWRAVRRSIGSPTIAEQLPALLADLRDGGLQPALPDRVASFGLSTMSSTQVAILQTLGCTRDVHLFVLHPSVAVWRSPVRALAGALIARSSADATATVANPLLRSWGRPPMETAALLAGIDSTDQACDPPPASPTPRTLTVLGRVQSEIMADTFDDTNPGETALVDRSVQIHACHGTTRQIEVLRDALGQLFAADPTLSARDVLVLCPDLTRFAALVPSVFQRSSLPVPVRVTDLSLGADNSVAATLIELLSTIAGRCTSADIEQLLGHAPVCRRFGLDADDVQRIERWVDDMGTTWGLDGDHRGQFVPDQIVEGTWSAMLDRLLLGAAMQTPVPRIGPANIVGFDAVDAAGLQIAGQLRCLISRLAAARSAFAHPLPIGGWVDLFVALLDDVVSVSADDEWQLSDVITALMAVSDHASNNSVPLTFADARTVVAGALSDDHGRLALRSGAVTVTSLLPVRTVPARVVCILGLDDAALRAGGLDGDDILSLRPCVGERDPRTQGRHLLLDALMAAEDHLVITCDGSDITTNRPLPLPVQVSELLDAIPTAARDCVVDRHPRQAYDETNFAAEKPFSFDIAMLAAARARRSAVSATAPWVPLPPLVPASVTIAQLTTSCTKPATTFLRERLQVSLPREPDKSVTSIPIRFTGLDQYQLGTELLDLARRQTTDEDMQSWRDARRLTGELPPQLLANAVLDEAAREVNVLLGDGADPPVRELLAASGTVHVDLSLHILDGDDHVRLESAIGGLHGDQLVRVSFKRPGPKSVIAAALELAALVVAQPDRSWNALVVTRPVSGSSKRTLEELSPKGGVDSVGAAINVLRTALTFHLRALREPLPYFEKSSRTLFDDQTIDDDEFERDINNAENTLLWGDYTADDVLAIPPLAVDESPRIAELCRQRSTGRADAFAHLLWQAVLDFVTVRTNGKEQAPE